MATSKAGKGKNKKATPAKSRKVKLADLGPKADPKGGPTRRMEDWGLFRIEIDGV